MRNLRAFIASWSIDPLEKQTVKRTRIRKEFDLKFRWRILAAFVNCRLKFREMGGMNFHCARIVGIIREEPQKTLSLENPRDLPQKFRPHHSPYVVATLGPRIRKEDVNIIRAQFGQLRNGFQTVAVDDRGIGKPESRDLFSRLVDALPLSLNTKKIRKGEPLRHFNEKSSLVASHVDLERRRAGPLPSSGKKVRRRFGERDQGMRRGLEERHAW